MPSHKYSIGQVVRFLPDRNQQALRTERFKVTRLLPEADRQLLYRVKCERDGHERVVREDQLARF